MAFQAFAPASVFPTRVGVNRIRGAAGLGR